MFIFFFRAYPILLSTRFVCNTASSFVLILRQHYTTLYHTLPWHYSFSLVIAYQVTRAGLLCLYLQSGKTYLRFWPSLGNPEHCFTQCSMSARKREGSLLVLIYGLGRGGQRNNEDVLVSVWPFSEVLNECLFCNEFWGSLCMPCWQSPLDIFFVFILWITKEILKFSSYTENNYGILYSFQHIYSISISNAF